MNTESRGTGVRVEAQYLIQAYVYQIPIIYFSLSYSLKGLSSAVHIRPKI